MSTATSGSVGLLQGFRRKIGRYGSATSVADHVDDRDGELDKDAPAPFVNAVREFREQDQLLRRLDGELSAMLEHLQVACTSMLQVAHLFSESLRTDPESHALSAEFLESVERIVRDGVEITEQSIRFTVVDPLVTRLERHDQLSGQLTAREQLARECRALRESVEQMKATGKPETDEKRRQSETKLAALLMEIDGIQRELLPGIENLTHGHGFTNQNDLFAAMRLHLATFFFNANKSLFPRLSTTEMEIVTGASYTDAARRAMSAVSQQSSQPSSSSFRLHKMSSITSEDWSEVDGSIFPEEDDSSRPSITLEEFEMGRSPPNLSDMMASESAVSSSSSKSSPGSGKGIDPDELLALAAHPVVDTCSHDEIDVPRSIPSEDVGIEMTSVLSPRTPERAATGIRSPSMFTSIGKSLRGKLGYQQKAITSSRERSPRARSLVGSEGLTDAGFLIVSPPHGAGHSPSRSPRRNKRASAATGSSHAIGLSPAEWCAIEACLWDIDARKCFNRQRHDAPDAVVSRKDLLSRILHEKESLAHECVSYLHLEDLVQLSKANRSLRASLLHCPPIWKQCIRSSELSRAMRRTVWLAAFYESTPWRSDDIAPHLLTRETRKLMYEQLVLKVGSKLTDAAVRKEPASEEDAQLLAWMQEIDVDVARTCHKDIYASDTDVEAEWDLTSRRSSASSLSRSRAPSSSVANEMTDEFIPDPTSIEQKTTPTVEEGQVGDQVRPHHIGGADVTSGGSPATSAEDPAKPTQSDQEAALTSDKAARRATMEAKIRRVLRAYVMYNPRVGYCQGMSFLVRLLADAAADEADIFWLFVGFSEPENDRNLYEPGLAVLQPFLCKYEILFSTHMPELYAHFQREGVHVASFCTRWFMTLFSSFETASPRLVMRLLDIFVIDGWRIIFSMALVVLDELRYALSDADLEGILRVLQSPRKFMDEQSAGKRRQLLRHALAFSISQMINSI